MKDKLVEEFLGELAQAGDEERKVTTTIEGAALRSVTKWRGERTVKDTVAAMLAIANSCLSEAAARQEDKGGSPSG